jgi:hypothetical protein
MSTFSTILTLGIVGVGGYLAYTQLWPIIRRQLEDLELGSSRRDDYYEPRPIVEDRYPDVVYEDRFPDYVIEDRYPDYIPYPVPSPVFPYPQTPYCPPGRYWDGNGCKRIKIDCPPGFDEHDGRCRPDCPSGYHWDDGRCKPWCKNDEYWDGRRCKDIPDRPRNCDRNEYWDGSRCRDIPTRPPRPRPDWDRDGRDRDDNDDRSGDWWNKDRPKPPTVPAKKTRKLNNTNNREKWHADRDKEDAIKTIISEKGPVEVIKEIGDATKRRREIEEKATQSFLEVWYA